MMGIPIDSLALLLGDSLSIILSTTIPSATLKKKHQAICYHRIRECIAVNVLCFAHINTKTNLVDVLTKPLLNNDFLQLVKPVLFRLPQHRFTQQEPCNISEMMTSCTRSPANAAIDLVALQKNCHPQQQSYHHQIQRWSQVPILTKQPRMNPPGNQC